MENLEARMLKDGSAEILVDGKVIAHGDSYLQAVKAVEFAQDVIVNTSCYSGLRGHLTASVGTALIGLVGTIASAIQMKRFPKGSAKWAYELGIFLTSTLFCGHGIASAIIDRNAMKKYPNYGFRYKAGTDETVGSTEVGKSEE